MTDRVEYYDDKANLLVAVQSSIVPPLGSKISIRKKTWTVKSVSYAVDHSDDIARREMRANVDLAQ